MNNLNTCLYEYIKDTKNYINNFKLGCAYYNIGQTASAVSYFLRAAEKTNDKLMQYNCLLLTALCFEKQGNRISSTKGLLYQALSLLPKRPEAYFLMSRLTERQEEFMESYTYACLALDNCDFSDYQDIGVEYVGKYSLVFQRGVSEWWIGLTEEAKKTMYTLYQEKNLNEIYNIIIINNLKNIGYPQYIAHYENSLYENFKFKFKGFNSIKKNYAQTYQDLFVLSVLEGKKNGYYLEIGSNDPFYNNNTALLEEFNWKGLSIDLDKPCVEKFKQMRKNDCLYADATQVNYKEVLKQHLLPNVIDYLQIDCDPPEITYNILTKIPFDTYKFAVITFEHDSYCNDGKIKTLSREFLESKGYLLLINNIGINEWNSYEDWWVHPELISQNIMDEMEFISDETKKVEDYFLKNIK
jgi:hypothetical protein